MTDAVNKMIDVIEVMRDIIQTMHPNISIDISFHVKRLNEITGAGSRGKQQEIIDEFWRNHKHLLMPTITETRKMEIAQSARRDIASIYAPIHQ
jgi:hypothetical protein